MYSKFNFKNILKNNQVFELDKKTAQDIIFCYCLKKVFQSKSNTKQNIFLINNLF